MLLFDPNAHLKNVFLSDSYNKKEEKKAYEKSSKSGNSKQTAIGPDGKVNPQAFKRPTKSSYK